MTGIINFIDHNSHLLHNHIFLSMCWNMIYFANKTNNFDISYLSELKVPSSFFFSYLGNELDILKQNQRYLDFLKYNPLIITRNSHLELYNLIYHSELKQDNQIDFFFKPGTKINQLSSHLNYIGNHVCYNIVFHCDLFNSRALNKNIVSTAFVENHPFYIDSFDQYIVKMRALTHKPPTQLLCSQLGNTGSHIMNCTYDVPTLFIKEMNVSNQVPFSVIDLIKNSNLVNMPNRNIDTLKLAINGNFHYSEPLVKFHNHIMNENINYSDSFNELQTKLKTNNTFMFDFYKKKPINNFSLNIKQKWK